MEVPMKNITRWITINGVLSFMNELSAVCDSEKKIVHTKNKAKKKKTNRM